MTINGKLNETQSETLSELLRELGLNPSTVAIEVNGSIPEKSLWPEFKIKPSDRIEIIRFVGGG